MEKMPLPTKRSRVLIFFLFKEHASCVTKEREGKERGTETETEHLKDSRKRGDG
jgi:NADH dehydrogenase/NADH:ubiquinone oxidoreductase subunit G